MIDYEYYYKENELLIKKDELRELALYQKFYDSIIYLMIYVIISNFKFLIPTLNKMLQVVSFIMFIYLINHHQNIIVNLDIDLKKHMVFKSILKANEIKENIRTIENEMHEIKEKQKVLK